MDGDLVLALVKDVGVPAGVAFYVLVRLDRRLGELITEVRGMNRSVVELLGRAPTTIRRGDAAE